MKKNYAPFTMFNLDVSSGDKRIINFLLYRVFLKMYNGMVSVIGKPVKKQNYSLIRSPHVNKKSMEQFQQSIYKSFMVFFNINVRKHLHIVLEQILIIFYFIYMSINKKVIAVFRIKNISFKKEKVDSLISLLSTKEGVKEFRSAVTVREAKERAEREAKKARDARRNDPAVIAKELAAWEKARDKRVKKERGIYSPLNIGRMVAGRKHKEEKWSYKNV